LLFGCLVFASIQALAATAEKPAPLKPAQACSSLLKADLSAIGGDGSRVTSAREATNSGALVCAVEGQLAPSIGFVMTLPLKTWTGRFLQVGCGGLCGRASLEVGAAEGCLPLQAGGFAIASTDMGHQGMSGDFGRDPQQRADFAHRAVHLTALAAKQLIRSFYGKPAARSYFTGCSDGGREALIEAQRYPEDFDGIIAGAGALNFQVQNSMYHAWQARSNTGLDGKAVLVASKLPLLHQAVLAQCDKLDGQADGLIANPRACHVDLAPLRCEPGVAASAKCLNEAELEAVRRLYDGPRDPETGERLTVAGPMPGSELAWAGVFVPESASQPIFSERIALDALRNLSFETDPPADFRLADLPFDGATFDRLRARHQLFDATNPDLSAFAKAGGKLILWHGWSDPHISPLNTVAYLNAVQRVMGAAQAEAFTRLYLLPGVYHCGNGEGPSAVDFLTPLLDWVERGVAPQAVVARAPSPKEAKSNFGQPTAAGASAAPAAAAPGAPPAATVAPNARLRPVFPYPAMAVHDGKGDPNTASSYSGVLPPSVPALPAWRGDDFFRPYAPSVR